MRLSGTVYCHKIGFAAQGCIEAAMDGCRVDIEGPGDLADGPAFLNQREGKSLLIRT